MTYVFSDTYKRVKVGLTASTPEGKGEVIEIRDHSAFPIHVRFADGRVNAFTQSEVTQ